MHGSCTAFAQKMGVRGCISRDVGSLEYESRRVATLIGSDYRDSSFETIVLIISLVPPPIGIRRRSRHHLSGENSVV